MISRRELSAYLDQLLSVEKVSDYCPNGLQVEGRETIRVIVTGVTASLALIERAIELKADAILVHHGYFWKNESPIIVGSKKARLAKLLGNDLNLFAYHLPLDTHPELGNNAQLAQVLNIQVNKSVTVDRCEHLLWLGELEQPVSGEIYARQLELKLGHSPLHIPGTTKPIQQLAWCTGAAQSYLEKAADLGVDAFISGEVSEATYHLAHERGIHYFAAGHHVTERYGIKALGQHLSEQFGLEHQFVDLPNPV